MDDITSSGSSDSSLEVLMNDYSSDCSRVLWIWLIEYIAKVTKDISCIHVAMQMGPELYDLGKNTNEVVSLRILQYLFDPSEKQTNDISTASKPKVEFDLSMSCNDVLQEILKETPLSDLKPGIPELSKWNVLPFIAQKRGHLPKCAMEKLRDVVFKVRDPKSVHRESQDRMNISDDDNDDVDVEILNLGSPKGSQRMEEKLNSVPPSPRNRDRVFGDDPNNGDSLCSVKDRHYMEIEGVKEGCDRNSATTIDDENCRNDADKLIPGASHGNEQAGCHIELLMGESTHITMTEHFVLPEDNPSTSLKENNSFENSHNRFGSNQEKQSLNETDRGDDLGLSDGTLEKDNLAKDKGEKELLHEDVLVSVANHNENHPSSSRAMPNLCVKCRRDDSLLVCSTRRCPIMVHEKCMKTKAEFGEMGNFLCPQCYYTRATSEYHKSVKQLHASKKRCAQFLKKLDSKRKEITERLGNSRKR